MRDDVIALFEFEVIENEVTIRDESAAGSSLPTTSRRKSWPGITRGYELKNYRNRAFEDFQWRQKPTREQIEAVAGAAVALRALRREAIGSLNYSLAIFIGRSNASDRQFSNSCEKL